MGACDFQTVAEGTTAMEAFQTVVKDAQWEHGHSGYSGTIAEKGSFIMIDVPDGKQPREYINQLFRDADERIIDKWGPAGCIFLGNNTFIFFGYASS